MEIECNAICLFVFEGGNVQSWFRVANYEKKIYLEFCWGCCCNGSWTVELVQSIHVLKAVEMA